MQREKPITSSTQTSVNPYHYEPPPPDEPFAVRYDTPFLFMVYERTHRLPIIVGCYAGEPCTQRALVDAKVPRLRKTGTRTRGCNCCRKTNDKD
ncbi:unnamed protein product [Gongylonema pulchrum]|uniref:Serpin domain-containing protein n=1 Tax=Gongylonema pulchrum TaxID=637853 RepID=A0A183EKI1_9BILA|nr:unnamed protein product [Gongylonema pulchrum]VDN46378.1 unnamed protein product [Gongylonema pulchrum]